MEPKPECRAGTTREPYWPRRLPPCNVAALIPVNYYNFLFLSRLTFLCLMAVMGNGTFIHHRNKNERKDKCTRHATVLYFDNAGGGYGWGDGGTGTAPLLAEGRRKLLVLARLYPPLGTSLSLSLSLFLSVRSFGSAQFDGGLSGSKSDILNNAAIAFLSENCGFLCVTQISM
jgi:hypothetical protein